MLEACKASITQASGNYKRGIIMQDTMNSTQVKELFEQEAILISWRLNKLRGKTIAIENGVALRQPSQSSQARQTRAAQPPRLRGHAPGRPGRDKPS